ncbi:MAG: TatD family hydrolase [Candidatus Azobacteroides sp.]|nr:TatD family hydrolase [Candidatus Azobacteroides sp.]
MYLIDSHTHLFSEEFDSDRDFVIQRAIEAGIRLFCLPNIDTESVERLHQVSDQYSACCFPMMGLHPTSVKAHYQHDLEVIKTELNKREYIAIGEIGLDLYWDQTFLNEQIHVFEEQLRWSIDRDLPVVIHTREAFPQVFESLYKVGIERLRGVFHSFGGTREELEEIVLCKNFMIGINGVITYKKANFRDYLPMFPLERIVLETDSPYLSPTPFRGKRNEPAYLLHTAAKLAEVYNLPIEKIAEVTTENARRLFFRRGLHNDT